MSDTLGQPGSHHSALPTPLTLSPAAALAVAFVHDLLFDFFYGHAKL